MILSEVPRELLIMVLERLAPHDCFTLQKTSRKFRELVDTEGPLSCACRPCKMYIDFPKQVFLQCYGGWVKTVVNGEIITELRNKAEPQSQYLERGYIVYRDVGHGWKRYVERFVKTLNKFYKQTSTTDLCELEVILSKHTNKISDSLCLFNVRFRKLMIQIADSETSPVASPPARLDAWLTRTVVTSDLFVQHALSPRHLDRITSPSALCWVNDEGALHILNKFINQQLPPLQFWFLIVTHEAVEFQKELVSRYGPVDFGSSAVNEKMGSLKLLVTQYHLNKNECLLTIRLF